MFGEAIYTYFVSGRVYYRNYGESAGFVFPGLIDTVSIAIPQNVINLPDRTQPGGGNYAQVRRVETVTATLNLREVKPSDLATVLYGANTQVPGATIPDEAHTVTLGAFIPLARAGGYTAVSVTTDATSPVAVSLDNYEIRDGGLWIYEDAPDLVDDDGILVTYTHPLQSRIQALTTGAPELELIFTGQNEARSDKNVRVRLHKCRVGTPADMQLLSGDDFSALSVELEVLKDVTITGAGLSKFFYEDIVN